VPLQSRTRVVLALMAGLPVAFLLLYPLAFGLLPIQWQEWADLPRDWMVFVMGECVILGLIEVAARVRSGREG
jgi:hypothetical protein